MASKRNAEVISDGFVSHWISNKSLTWYDDEAWQHFYSDMCRTGHPCDRQVGYTSLLHAKTDFPVGASKPSHETHTSFVGSNGYSQRLTVSRT